MNMHAYMYVCVCACLGICLYIYRDHVWCVSMHTCVYMCVGSACHYAAAGSTKDSIMNKCHPQIASLFPLVFGVSFCFQISWTCSGSFFLLRLAPLPSGLEPSGLEPSRLEPSTCPPSPEPAEGPSPATGLDSAALTFLVIRWGEVSFEVSSSAFATALVLLRRGFAFASCSL